MERLVKTLGANQGVKLGRSKKASKAMTVLIYILLSKCKMTLLTTMYLTEMLACQVGKWLVPSIADKA